jgi:hypothetical protein
MKTLLLTLLLLPLTIFSQSIYFQNGATISLKGSINIYIQDGSSTAIQSTGTSGFYITDNGVGTIDWNIQSNTGTYTIPFISTANENVPVTINITTPGIGTTLKFSNIDGPPTNYPTFWDPNSINRYWNLNFDNYTTLPTGSITIGWTYNDVPTSYLDVQLKYYKDVYSGVWTNNELATNIIPSNPLLLRTTTFPINQYLNTLNSNHTWTLVNPNTPLPVELTIFEAYPVNNEYIMTHWETAIEINNLGFTIERSQDAIHFDSIGFVQGANNSTSTKFYYFPDHQVNKNTLYYYRLKQIDNDGHFVYSNIVSAMIFDNSLTFDIFPNPSNTQTQFYINSSTEKEVTIKITDMLGRKVIENKQLIVSGVNKIDFSTSSLAAASYNVTLIDGENSITRKLVVVK